MKKPVTAHCEVGRQRGHRHWRIKGRGYGRAHAVLGMHIVVPTTLAAYPNDPPQPASPLSRWRAPLPTVPAPRGALGACRRSPARRLPCAARRYRAALWPPTAAVLCRAAFAGGLVPFSAFERALALFSPSCSSPPCFIPRSCTDGAPLREVMLTRVGTSPRPSSPSPSSSPALKRTDPATRLWGVSVRARRP